MNSSRLPHPGVVEQSSTTPRGRSLAAERGAVGDGVEVAVCLDGSAVSAWPEVAPATATAAATATLAIAVRCRAVIAQRYTGGLGVGPSRASTLESIHTEDIPFLLGATIIARQTFRLTEPSDIERPVRLPDGQLTSLPVKANRALVVGAGLLTAGVLRWYGRRARLFRLGGVLLVLLTAIVSVSLEFIFVPIALLVVPSLKIREPPAAELA